MRTWTRIAVACRCGGCGRELALDMAVLLIEFTRDGRTLRFLRCTDCEGPAPFDLPTRLERTPIRPTPLHRVGTLLPFMDWKLRAAAEREPGEEG